MQAGTEGCFIAIVEASKREATQAERADEKHGNQMKSSV